MALTVCVGRVTAADDTASPSIEVSTTSARRSAGPFGEPLAQPPDLAGILDQREPGAHRSHAAYGNIGRHRHRKTRGRKAQHQAIGVLAHDQMLAFAHHIADVAEDKQIAGHST